MKGLKAVSQKSWEPQEYYYWVMYLISKCILPGPYNELRISEWAYSQTPYCVVDSVLNYLVSLTTPTIHS